MKVPHFPQIEFLFLTILDPLQRSIGPSEDTAPYVDKIRRMLAGIPPLPRKVKILPWKISEMIISSENLKNEHFLDYYVEIG